MRPIECGASGMVFSYISGVGFFSFFPLPLSCGSDSSGLTAEHAVPSITAMTSRPAILTKEFTIVFFMPVKLVKESEINHWPRKIYPAGQGRVQGGLFCTREAAGGRFRGQDGPFCTREAAAGRSRGQEGPFCTREAAAGRSGGREGRFAHGRRRETTNYYYLWPIV